MLKVGIHENVVVSKAVINEHGTLEIEFLQKGSNDALGALSGNVELSKDESVNIRSYGQNVEYFQQKRTGEQMFKLVIGFKSILTELLAVYIDNPVIDAGKGISITNDNINTVFSDQAVVDVAYNNIITQFVTLITPFLGKEGFRVKLPRKSAKSAFPSLPTYGPWVETMDIPVEATKLKWTPWEIENKKNDSTIAADVVTATAQDLSATKLEGVFSTAGPVNEENEAESAAS